MKTSDVAAAGRVNDQSIEPTLPQPYAGRIQSPTARNAAGKHLPDMASDRGRDKGHPAIVSAAERMHDEHIVSAIAHTLEWNRIIPGNLINAMSCGGHVTLAGYVHSRQDREEAEMLVRRLPGVYRVDNRIEVLTDDMLSGRLKSAIMDLLQRHARRFGRDIGVEMKNGKVVLTGKVETLAEKRLVLDALGWISYVHAIEDRLEIGPG